MNKTKIMKKNTLLLVLILLLFVACNTTSSEKTKSEASADGAKQETVKEKSPQKTEVKKDEESTKTETKNNEEISSKGEFYAYFVDPDRDNPTNIRRTPGGEIVYKVPIEDRDYFEVKLVECRGKWFRIEGGLVSYIPDEGVEDVELTGDCWVHSSVIGAMLVGRIDNPVLRKNPDENSEIAAKIPEQADNLLIFLDMKDNWVKVEYGMEDNKTIKGWMPANWICSNPLTTCP